jgi:hypothetical protein
VRTGAKVESCDAGGIIAAGQCIEARTLYGLPAYGRPPLRDGWG